MKRNYLAVKVKVVRYDADAVVRVSAQLMDGDYCFDDIFTEGEETE